MPAGHHEHIEPVKQRVGCERILSEQRRAEQRGDQRAGSLWREGRLCLAPTERAVVGGNFNDARFEHAAVGVDPLRFDVIVCPGQSARGLSMTTYAIMPRQTQWE